MAWMAAAVPVPPAPTMHTSACTVSFGSPSSGMLQMASSAAVELPDAALASEPSAGASALASLVCCGPQPVSAAPAKPAVRIPAPARKERLLKLLVAALMMDPP